MIKKAAYLTSSPSYDKTPVADRPEFAFIGRSNVGKSSLINMLANNQKLAKTSGTPGKTQMINHFTVESIVDDESNNKQTLANWYLVDLPGYGFAKVSQTARKQWKKMIDDYLVKRENLTEVFVLIDSRHSPQKIDLEFLEALQNKKVDYSIIFTKTDKVKQAEVAKNVQAFITELKKNNRYLPQYFISSAAKQTGKQRILEHIQNRIQAVTVV